MTTDLTEWARHAWQAVRGDLCRFYGRRGLLRLGAGLLVGGLLANSPLDQRAQDWYQGHLRSPSTDGFHLVTKKFGYDRTVAAVTGAAVLVGLLCASHPAGAAVGAWGAQLARAGLLSVPPLLVGQRLLGASRPSELHGSAWHCGADDNSISGHAMGGALLFLTAAEMAPHPVARAALYACSALPGLSRINTDSHYPSQVLLGWWLAFLAVRAVRRSRPRAPDATRTRGY